jgi:hypothetical protein
MKKRSEAGRSSTELSRVEFRDARRTGYELGSGGIELSQVFGIFSSIEIAANQLNCAKKTSCVI